MNKKKVLNDYISYKKLTVKSDKIKDLEFYTNRFLTFRKKNLDKYVEKDLIDYLNTISPEYANETLNYIKANVKNFIKWHFLDYSSRFRNLDNICRTRKSETSYTPDDMLTEEDFSTLIEGEKNQFWKAYFLTLIYGGCRPIEVCNLEWSNVEFEKNGGAFITIHSKKNKRNFLKYIPPEHAYYLDKLKTLNDKWVFFNESTGKPITKKGAYFRIRQLSNRVLGRKIHLYTLRHSIATILYNSDQKDDIVAMQMGHTKSQKQTYTHNDKKRLKENAKKLFSSVEELPEEKKHELEREVEELKEKERKTVKMINDLTSTLQSLEKNFKGLRQQIDN